MNLPASPLDIAGLRRCGWKTHPHDDPVPAGDFFGLFSLEKNREELKSQPSSPLLAPSALKINEGNLISSMPGLGDSQYGGRMPAIGDLSPTRCGRKSSGLFWREHPNQAGQRNERGMKNGLDLLLERKAVAIDGYAGLSALVRRRSEIGQVHRLPGALCLSASPSETGKSQNDSVSGKSDQNRYGMPSRLLRAKKSAQNHVCVYGLTRNKIGFFKSKKTQHPVNFGGRFSVKALTASPKSSVIRPSTWAWFSRSTAAAKLPASRLVHMTRLVCAVE